ncbi:MAG: ATP-binding protein, partial [Porticoccaceae bacterium]|nr:ATP-binding protein [Porticoccaceae bacterium]
FSVAELVNSLQELSRQRLASVNGQLHIDTALPEATLNGNCDALASALLNLVDNAVDLVGEGAQVTLGASVSHNRLHLCLTDNGPGIDESIREQIFDPFFTTRVQGTGLGLAVVAATVRGHGGNVEVNNSPRGGAEFVIQLPVKIIKTENSEAHS